MSDDGRTVRFIAVAQPGHFNRFWVQPGHHAVVWNGGRARWGALFVSEASDHEVRSALARIGARAGENLSASAWSARYDRRNREPDRRVEGAPLEVLVEWKGSAGAIPIDQLIAENGHVPALDFRFGGNERFQPEFKSGCIVCTSSCPGGAIGNHNRTIREEMTRANFTPVRSRLPEAETRVTIVLRLRRS